MLSVEPEGEEAPLLTPNQMRGLVRLEAELEKNTNCTTNLEENVRTIEMPENLEGNVPTARALVWWPISITTLLFYKYCFYIKCFSFGS